MDRPDTAPPGIPPASRRGFLGQAAAAALLGTARHPAQAAGSGYTPDRIAMRDAANVAASIRARAMVSPRYQPLTGGIVHFFGYGQSLSGGWYGVPVVSTTQPYDSLMIGQSTRASLQPRPDTTWIPTGSPNAAGIYPFNPMIATPEDPAPVTSGETPGEGAMNFLRRAYLAQLGLTSNNACRFVLTNCADGGNTIAKLEKGANPEVFNRLRNAATTVKATADSLGLSYQVGGMIWTQGEQDVAFGTSYASYLSSLQTLQQSFLTDIVQTIAGQPPGVVVPWFCHQPDSDSIHRTTAVFQALLDWSNTPDSDFYLAGPVYQYPDHVIHLTANSYRWHANQVGKAMASVLLNQGSPSSLHVTAATSIGPSILVDLSVPVPPLILGDVYNQYTKTVYPGLGFLVTDSGGQVPVISAAIVGEATIQIQLGRALRANAMLQAGYNLVKNQDWGTNICDSDTTLAVDPYVYTPGIQSPGENIPTWNGAPLIGQPYPLNNYCAVGSVPITPDS